MKRKGVRGGYREESRDWDYVYREIRKQRESGTYREMGGGFEQCAAIFLLSFFLQLFMFAIVKP